MLPTIILSPNKPTTAEIKLVVDNTDEQNTSTVKVAIEEVNGGELVYTATHNHENVWSVTIPPLNIGETSTNHNIRVDVVINERVFSAHCGAAAIRESVNSGTMTAPGPDVQITNRFTGEPEEPIEAKLQYPVGQNNDEHLDDEDYQEYNQDKTEDIASETTPGEGPQIPQVPTPAEVAARIVSQVMGQLRKPETKGSLFNRDANGKPVIRGLEDPKTREQQLEKSRKVRDILGLD